MKPSPPALKLPSLRPRDITYQWPITARHHSQSLISDLSLHTFDRLEDRGRVRRRLNASINGPLRGDEEAGKKEGSPSKVSVQDVWAWLEVGRSEARPKPVYKPRYVLKSLPKGESHRYARSTERDGLQAHISPVRFYQKSEKDQDRSRLRRRPRALPSLVI